MKTRQVIFIIIVFSFMSLFGCYSLIMQKEGNISTLEKRELRYIIPLNLDNWLEKEFQASMENGLIDNFWQRNKWLGFYNKTNMSLNHMGYNAVSVFLNKNKNNAVNVQKINEKVSYIEEIRHLIRTPTVYNDEKAKEVIENINKIRILKDKYNSIDFYIYLPLLAHHNNIFADNYEGIYYYDLFKELSIPFDRLRVNDIYDLKRMYYSTDHHWSHIGSYEGYKDIVNLLFKSEVKPRIPIREEILDNVTFFGSHSRIIAHAINLRGDIMVKYIFDLPEYELYIDEESISEYGHFTDYVNGDIDNSKDFDHYNWLYQSRKGKIIFDTKRGDLGNILIISDSMSNAIRDVLASHFNKSIFINLDTYKRKYGDFNIDYYFNEYDINKVLIMVNLGGYFSNGELKNLNIE